LDRPAELARKMFEMADSSSLDVQREIIAALPSTIDDRVTDDVTVGLKQMLSSHPDLTVSILDALSNLSLDEDCMSEIRDQVLDDLAGYESEAGDPCDVVLWY
jgi:hypothetical protein